MRYLALAFIGALFVSAAAASDLGFLREKRTVLVSEKGPDGRPSVLLESFRSPERLRTRLTTHHPGGVVRISEWVDGKAFRLESTIDSAGKRETQILSDPAPGTAGIDPAGGALPAHIDPEAFRERMVIDGDPDARKVPVKRIRVFKKDAEGQFVLRATRRETYPRYR
jgi:hypothetical protein